MFLNYANNRHTHRQTAKNVIFGFRGPQNVEIHQNLLFENDPNTIFSPNTLIFSFSKYNIIGKTKQKIRNNLTINYDRLFHIKGIFIAKRQSLKSIVKNMINHNIIN